MLKKLPRKDTASQLRLQDLENSKNHCMRETSQFTSFVQANLSFTSNVKIIRETLSQQASSRYREEKPLPWSAIWVSLEALNGEADSPHVAEIEEAFEKQEFCPVIFLDLGQTFDRV